MSVKLLKACLSRIHCVCTQGQMTHHFGSRNNSFLGFPCHPGVMILQRVSVSILHTFTIFSQSATITTDIFGNARLVDNGQKSVPSAVVRLQGVLLLPRYTQSCSFLLFVIPSAFITMQHSSFADSSRHLSQLLLTCDI